MSSPAEGEHVKLRHGLVYLVASDIADQFYCEYKVHLKLLHPEVREQQVALELGDAAHAALAARGEPVSLSQIQEAIRTGKKLDILEQTLVAQFRGVEIRGRPDRYRLKGQEALLLLDFKLKRRKSFVTKAQGPFLDNAVQAEIYGWLLGEHMGLRTEQLCLGIVLVADPVSLVRDSLLRAWEKDGTLDHILQRCWEARATLLREKRPLVIVEGPEWKAFLWRYEPGELEKHLDWALGYWLEERDPLPVRDKKDRKKCATCHFNAVGFCEYALSRPDDRFRIERRANGEIIVKRIEAGWHSNRGVRENVDQYLLPYSGDSGED